MLLYDDFGLLRESWTWPTAQDSLWRPNNEHVMPLGRVATWLLIQLSGRAVVLPYAAAAQGSLVVLFAMVLLCQFVRREMGHAVYGLVAAGLFGITTQYEEAVSWYAASFALVTLAMTLLALLAAQRWRQTGRARHLVASAVWSCVALGWFGSGLLAGPLTALYLLATSAPEVPVAVRPAMLQRLRAKLPALAPLAGTAFFLAVSLPRTGDAILHTGHYEGKTAFQAFHLDTAVLYTARSLVDNLLLGSFGIGGVLTPTWLVPLVLLVLLAAGLWWFWSTPVKPLLVLGLGAILASYLLIYGARSQWSYEQLAGWSRYQIYAHFGLVLFVCGGLSRWRDWFVGGTGFWAPTRLRFWTTALTILLLTQVWHGWPSQYDSKQLAQLRVVDAVDALCREYHVGVTDAQAALRRWQMVGGTEQDNVWDLLRGGDSPRQQDPAEIRRLLQPVIPNGGPQS